MEQLHAQGRARAIGVSNFLPDRLVDLIVHNDVTPAVNQIETHVFYQRGEDHRIMNAYGVRHESWGPFAEGRNNMFTDPTLTAIAAAHGRSVGQVGRAGRAALADPTRRDRDPQIRPPRADAREPRRLRFRTHRGPDGRDRRDGHQHESVRRSSRSSISSRPVASTSDDRPARRPTRGHPACHSCWRSSAPSTSPSPRPTMFHVERPRRQLIGVNRATAAVIAAAVAGLPV